MEKKIVMVTGATSGIGEACAKKFANGGYNVIITGRRHDKLEALKTQLEAQGARVLARKGDKVKRNPKTVIVDKMELLERDLRERKFGVV